MPQETFIEKQDEIAAAGAMIFPAAGFSSYISLKTKDRKRRPIAKEAI